MITSLGGRKDLAKNTNDCYNKKEGGGRMILITFSKTAGEREKDADV